MADKRWVWTQERVATARRMWRDGASASMIGLAIGCSRNAVIGKLYRLRINWRRATVERLQPGVAKGTKPARPGFWQEHRDWFIPLFDMGLTNIEIAARAGREFGVRVQGTSIAAALVRIGLTRTPEQMFKLKSRAMTGRPMPRKREKPRRVVKPTALTVVPPSARPIYDLPEDRECRFIYGDPRDGGHWCCGTTQPGSSWCELHEAVVYSGSEGAAPEPVFLEAAE